MNRTDRLLALIIEMRVRGTCTAEDLAAFFGVSKRTIYRDIQALNEAGVPVVSLMGEGYRLSEDYFLPPLAFTEEEAALILLGLSTIEGSFDHDYRTIAQYAYRKILAVLSDAMRDRTDQLQKRLFLGNTVPVSSQEQESLRVLRRAILLNQVVQFRYFSRHSDQVSMRSVDPYSLACLSGVWYLVGYCHLRQDKRFFRLSRVENVQLMQQKFQLPPNYHVTDEAARDDRTELIQLLFDEDVQQWIMEDRFFYIHAREPRPEGVLVTLRVRNVNDVIQWVLGWGQHVRVLEPESVRLRVREEALAMLKNHD